MALFPVPILERDLCPLLFLSASSICSQTIFKVNSFSWSCSCPQCHQFLEMSFVHWTIFVNQHHFFPSAPTTQLNPIDIRQNGAHCGKINGEVMERAVF